MTSWGRINMVVQKLNMPKIIVLRSCAVPAKEIFLVLHSLILATILSTRALHSSLLYLLAVSGTPKYLIGKVPSWNPVISKHCYCKGRERPPKTIWDFSWLACEPALLWKIFKLLLIIWRVRGWALQKIITSSANIRWFSFKALHEGWKPNCGWVPASIINLVKYSIVKTNNASNPFHLWISHLFVHSHAPWNLLKWCNS